MKNIVTGIAVILIVIALIAGVIFAFGDQRAVMTKAIQDSGFTEVEVGNHAWFAGSKYDTFANHFTARNVQSNLVHGVVSGGPLKGYTIRMGN